MLSVMLLPTRWTRGICAAADAKGFSVIIADNFGCAASGFWMSIQGRWFDRFDNGARASMHGWIDGQRVRRTFCLELAS